MRVWAVANQKGGVGKTTTTVNLAGLLAAAGRNTLVVDLDPHGSLTSYFGYNPDVIDHSVYKLFQTTAPDVRSLLLDTGIANLKLLPASSALATLDRQLGAREGKGLIIAKALQALAQDYAYVLIDCPPVLGVLMVNALAACERLLIPVQSEFLALRGLERMTKTLHMINQARKIALPYTIIPTMFDKRTRTAHESLKELRDSYPYNLWHDVIPIDTQFRDASKLRMPLTLLNPKSRGAVAYRTLLTQLLINPVESSLPVTEKAP